jgi:spore germination protein GerM
MRRILAVIVLAAGVGVGGGWVLLSGIPQWIVPRPGATPEPLSQPAGPEAQRKIHARLFFVSEDGLHLVAVEREIPYGEGTLEQARRIVEAQLDAPPPPLAQAIPAGTRLLGLYVTEQGHAYVDLSADVSRQHTGGSLDELFAIYEIVNALTVNLPAIAAVQILVDGREVDSLAGHIDLRRPLPRSLAWVAEAAAPSSP